MNGAESPVATLAADGVEWCFANPGTSEMHFVAALDRDRVSIAKGQGVPGVRVQSAEEFVRELQGGFASRRPYPIEALI